MEKIIANDATDKNMQTHTTQEKKKKNPIEK